VLAGAGLAGWRELTSEVQPAPSSPEQPAAAGLWSMSFASLQGGTLSLAAWRGRPLLLNFWATWCPPCIEELPLLDRFYQENSANGWQVLGIAVDQQDPVQRFLSRFPLTFPVVLAGFAGMELSKSLGNMSGGLPFTVVLGQDGVVAHRKMGKVSVSDLSAWQRLR
jgi:thiol-disulfide isomerase/thioredoxin